MNERIKKLYIQTANETANGKEWAIGGMNNAERFAKLIVMECAYIMDKDADHPFVSRGSILKHHFGVEE